MEDPHPHPVPFIRASRSPEIRPLENPKRQAERIPDGLDFKALESRQGSKEGGDLGRRGEGCEVTCPDAPPW